MDSKNLEALKKLKESTENKLLELLRSKLNDLYCDLRDGNIDLEEVYSRFKKLKADFDSVMCIIENYDLLISDMEVEAKRLKKERERQHSDMLKQRDKDAAP